MRRKPRVLVIDDGEAYARIIDQQLEEFDLVRPEEGLSCLPDGPSALAYLQNGVVGIDVILLDMNFDVATDKLFSLGDGVSPRRTKRFQGAAILNRIRKILPSFPVVLLTSVEDLSLVDEQGELASQSMTYFLESSDLDSLRIRLHSALQEASESIEQDGILWGEDPAMRALQRRLKVLANGRMPVILEGETGTGKSFLAERFVYEQSHRAGPFVILDIASIPKELVPAHLFGAVKGAYTGAVSDRKGVFEVATGGVLFIDEIQNIPTEAQKQLLLVLQDGRVRPLGSTKERAVDVKVIAATSSKLDQAVREGRFRADLYMRLSPATKVVIPPLRQRPRDLLFLAHRFAAKAVDEPDIDRLRTIVADYLGLGSEASLGLVIGRKREGRQSDLQLVLPEPAWLQMEQHRWPGNIRELDMVIRNIVTFTLVGAVDAIESGLMISSHRLQVDPGLVASLLEGSRGMDIEHETKEHSGDGLSIDLQPGDTLNAVANSVERQYFVHLFRKAEGNFSKMADRLLGDSTKGRAIRLRFNQLGLKVREIKI